MLGNLLVRWCGRLNANTQNTLILSRYEYNNQIDKKIKTIQFQEDGQTIDFIDEYDPQTKKLIQKTVYKEDGKSIDFVDEYDPQTEKLIQKTVYKEDGKIIYNEDLESKNNNGLQNNINEPNSEIKNKDLDYDNSKIKIIFLFVLGLLLILIIIYSMIYSKKTKK